MGKEIANNHKYLSLDNTININIDFQSLQNVFYEN